MRVYFDLQGPQHTLPDVHGVQDATKVAGESPELYFEIQHLNDYGRESLLALRGAVEKLWLAVSTGDAPQFTAIMQQGREYLAGRVRHD